MIGFFELENGEVDLVKKAFPSAYTSTEQLRETDFSSLANCEVLSVFIYTKINEEVLRKFPKLKLICTRSTGFDHIDIDACKKRGITVCNVPTYGDHTVAQHTFALLLAITRKLIASTKSVKQGEFTPSQNLRGTDIHEKILGVIGTGRIGKNVIRIAKGFGMPVVAYDVIKDEKAAKEIGYTYVTLDELFAQSHIISLHTPMLPSTKHIIDRAAIKKTKAGVIILNTARGGLIDTHALYEGLHSGHVAAAGLDVLEEEASSKEEKQLLSKQFQKEIDYRALLLNHMLIQHPNVIITPHNAFNSTEALQRIINTTIENVQAFQSGTPQNTVSS